MSILVSQATDGLRSAIIRALELAMEKGALPQAQIPAFTLEIPADRARGDWACNAAMVGARAFHTAPRAIAQAISDHLDLSGTAFSRCEIAGPGFLNFT